MRFLRERFNVPVLILFLSIVLSVMISKCFGEGVCTSDKELDDDRDSESFDEGYVSESFDEGYVSESDRNRENFGLMDDRQEGANDSGSMVKCKNGIIIDHQNDDDCDSRPSCEKDQGISDSDNAEKKNVPGGGVEEKNVPGGGVEEKNVPGGGVEEKNVPGGGVEEKNVPGGSIEEKNVPGGSVEEKNVSGDPGDFKNVKSFSIDNYPSSPGEMDYQDTSKKNGYYMATTTVLQLSNTLVAMFGYLIGIILGMKNIALTVTGDVRRIVTYGYKCATYFAYLSTLLRDTICYIAIVLPLFLMAKSILKYVIFNTPFQFSPIEFALSLILAGFASIIDRGNNIYILIDLWATFLNILIAQSICHPSGDVPLFKRLSVYYGATGSKAKATKHNISSLNTLGLLTPTSNNGGTTDDSKKDSSLKSYRDLFEQVSVALRRGGEAAGHS